MAHALLLDDSDEVYDAGICRRDLSFGTKRGIAPMPPLLRALLWRQLVA